MPFVPISFLVLVWPGANSSALAPSGDAFVPSSFLLLVRPLRLVAMPFVPSSFL